MDNTKLKITAWSLTAFVLITAIVAWGQDLGWKLGNISGYQWFPVLGLTAFSLMWTHYIMGVIRRHFGLERSAISQYFKITSWIVLFAILFHPGILIVKLFADGYGLPPQSYINVYGMTASMKFALLLGSVSLMAFLAFEFRRFFGKKPWWKYVGYASDVAMLAIFYHGLQLGGQLQNGWYRGLWYFYGVTLVLALIYTRFGWLWQKERP